MGWSAGSLGHLGPLSKYVANKIRAAIDADTSSNAAAVTKAPFLASG